MRWLSKIFWYFISEEKKEGILIRRLRNEFEMFGFDMSDFTDEDIKNGAIEMGRVTSLMGLSTEGVAAAMADLGKK